MIDFSKKDLLIDIMKLNDACWAFMKIRYLSLKNQDSHMLKMKILVFLFALVIGHPMHREKTCSATCSGVVDDWKSYSTNGNGVTTTGKDSFTSSF